MRTPKISVYKTSHAIRSRVDGGTGCYATESIVRATTLYALWDDEIAIVQDDVTIRMPMELAEEVAALVEDIRDSKERGLFRERQRIYENRRLQPAKA